MIYISSHLPTLVRMDYEHAANFLPGERGHLCTKVKVKMI